MAQDTSVQPDEKEKRATRDKVMGGGGGGGGGGGDNGKTATD